MYMYMLYNIKVHRLAKSLKGPNLVTVNTTFIVHMLSLVEGLYLIFLRFEFEYVRYKQI